MTTKLNTADLVTLLSQLVLEARRDLSAELHHVGAIQHMEKAVNILKNGPPVAKKHTVRLNNAPPQPVAPLRAPPIREPIRYLQEQAAKTDYFNMLVDPQVKRALEDLVFECAGVIVQHPDATITVYNDTTPFYVGVTTATPRYIEGFILACLHDPAPRFLEGYRALEAGTLRFLVEPVRGLANVEAKAQKLAELRDMGHALLNK